MFREGEREQRELLKIFDALRPALQKYLLRTARELLFVQEKIGEGQENRKGIEKSS